MLGIRRSKANARSEEAGGTRRWEGEGATGSSVLLGVGGGGSHGWEGKERCGGVCIHRSHNLVRPCKAETRTDRWVPDVGSNDPKKDPGNYRHTKTCLVMRRKLIGQPELKLALAGWLRQS